MTLKRGIRQMAVSDQKLGTGSDLVNYIQPIWESFKSGRQPWETIWEECWYNFLGQYQANLAWRRKTEGTNFRSRVFIKLTTLKCHTAHSKVIDVLFGGRDNIPFDLEAIDADLLGIDPETAKKIVDKSKQRLRDHFKYIDLEETVDTAVLELTILGTAVLKGPIIEYRMRPEVNRRTIAGMPIESFDRNARRWELRNSADIVPVMDHVPLWEYYTDANAKNTKDAIGEIHFQRLLPATFKKLAYQGGYIRENVLEAAERASQSHADDKKYIQLGDNYAGTQDPKDKRVAVLEYWGLVPIGCLEEFTTEEQRQTWPAGKSDNDSVEALVVLGADSVVCKATINPIGRRIFHVCPYKKRPHVIYGQGVAEMMRDSQKMVNSAARLIVDNKALSGNGLVGINADRINMKRTKNLEIYPLKTFYTKGNFAPKDAIDSITFQDVTQGLKDLMEMFERFADEETGIPKYTHGEQDSFLNKTAHGMSMLMTQANINLKAAMKNIDNYWTEPIVEAMYAWFSEMQPEKGIGEIPMKVKAMGSDSLIAKELKIESYMKFLQITQNPQDAIFTDRVKLIRNIARLLETDDILRTEDEVKEIMEEMRRQAITPKDIREMVDIDRLFPLLARTEQEQILTMLGINPAQFDPRIALSQLKRIEKAPIPGTEPEKRQNAK